MLRQTRLGMNLGGQPVSQGLESSETPNSEEINLMIKFNRQSKAKQSTPQLHFVVDYAPKIVFLTVLSYLR